MVYQLLQSRSHIVNGWIENELYAQIRVEMRLSHNNQFGWMQSANCTESIETGRQCEWTMHRNALAINHHMINSPRADKLPFQIDQFPIAPNLLLFRCIDWALPMNGNMKDSNCRRFPRWGSVAFVGSHNYIQIHTFVTVAFQLNRIEFSRSEYVYRTILKFKHSLSTFSPRSIWGETNVIGNPFQWNIVSFRISNVFICVTVQFVAFAPAIVSCYVHGTLVQVHGTQQAYRTRKTTFTTFSVNFVAIVIWLETLPPNLSL